MKLFAPATGAPGLTACSNSRWPGCGHSLLAGTVVVWAYALAAAQIKIEAAKITLHGVLRGLLFASNAGDEVLFRLYELTAPIACRITTNI